MSTHLVEVGRHATARVGGGEELVFVRHRFSPIGGDPKRGTGICVRVIAEEEYDTCICDRQVIEWCD